MMNRYYKLQKSYQKWQQLTQEQQAKLCDQLRRYRKFNCYYLIILTVIAIPLIYSAFFMAQQTGQGLKQMGAILILIGYGLVVRRTLWTHRAYHYVDQQLKQTDSS